MSSAAAWPNRGCVIVVRAHEKPGPTGWFRNEQNPATGWYWHLCDGSKHERETVLFKRRQDAMTDAEATFDNINGWKQSSPHNFYATVVTH